MKEEFNLSEKIYQDDIGVKYVKLFIRKLKEKFDKNDWENNTLDVPENRDLIIDKLAGEKLI